MSGLLKNCSGLESLTRLVEKQAQQDPGDSTEDSTSSIKALSEMLSGKELDIIGKYGGVLQKHYEGDVQGQRSTSKEATLQHHVGSSRAPNAPHVVLADGSDDSDQGEMEAHPPSTVKDQQEPVVADQIAPEINLSVVYKYVSVVRMCVCSDPLTVLRSIFSCAQHPHCVYSSRPRPCARQECFNRHSCTGLEVHACGRTWKLRFRTEW